MPSALQKRTAENGCLMNLGEMETRDVIISIESSAKDGKDSLRSPGHSCLGRARCGERAGSPCMKPESKSLRREESYHAYLSCRRRQKAVLSF